MKINEIIDLIENFAPLEAQESWDCCGFQIDLGPRDVKKVLLALSVTENVINQAVKKNCDLIISHHPMFFIPFEFQKGISVYSAHTNLDKAQGGTTDALISLLDLEIKNIEIKEEFLRIVELKKFLTLGDFVNLIKNKLNISHVRVINNKDVHKVGKIAFCAGSGTDFLDEVQKIRADLFVTGDVKYHTALESNVIIVDVGHFESERPVLKKIKKIFELNNLEVIIADEKSPFINY